MQSWAGAKHSTATTTTKQLANREGSEGFARSARNAIIWSVLCRVGPAQMHPSRSGLPIRCSALGSQLDSIKCVSFFVFRAPFSFCPAGHLCAGGPRMCLIRGHYGGSLLYTGVPAARLNGRASGMRPLVACGQDQPARAGCHGCMGQPGNKSADNTETQPSWRFKCPGAGQGPDGRPHHSTARQPPLQARPTSICAPARALRRPALCDGVPARAFSGIGRWPQNKRLTGRASQQMRDKWTATHTKGARKATSG